MKRPRISHVGGLVLVALVAVIAAGCGDDSTSGSTTTGAVTADPTIAAAVPAAIRSKGTLTVAADATYAPNEFIGADGKTVEGMDPDLAKALGEVHGPRGQGRRTRPSTASSRASRPASTTSACRRSPTPRSARRSSTSSPTSTAGHVLLREGGRGSDDQLARRPLRPHGRRRARDDAGRRRHRAEREVQGGGQAGRHGPRLPGPERARTWRSRAAGPRSAWPTRRSPPYIVKQSNGQFKLTGEPYGTAPYGIAIPKESGMAQPVLDALKVLIAERHLQDDPDEVGRPGRAPSQPADQRGDQLAAGRVAEWPRSRGAETPPGPVAARTRSRRSRSAIPGRWVAAAIILRPRRRRSSTRSRPTRASSGGSSATTSSRSRVLDGLVVTLELTVARDGDRDRARGDPRGDAPVAEPARLRARAGSTSGSSAARRCSSRSSSGTTSRRSTRASSLGHPVRADVRRTSTPTR